jgi:hypothetical protein
LPGFFILIALQAMCKLKQVMLSFFRRNLWCGAGAALCLTGCAVLPQTNVGLLGRIWQQFSPINIATVPLNSQYQYKRVWLNGREGLISLSYVEPLPDGKSQTVWYSPDGYVFRFIDGRLTGLTFKERAWYGRYINAPTLLIQTSKNSVSPVYNRRADEMPSYLFGSEVSLQLQPLPAAPQGHRLIGTAERYTWLEERVTGHGDKLTSGSTVRVEPAWYAVSYRTTPAKVVFGQQCLQPDLCLSWQDWPVAAND